MRRSWWLTGRQLSPDSAGRRVSTAIAYSWSCATDLVSCDSSLCRKEAAHWQHEHCTSWANFLKERRKKIFLIVLSETCSNETQQGQTKVSTIFLAFGFQCNGAVKQDKFKSCREEWRNWNSFKDICSTFLAQNVHNSGTNGLSYYIVYTLIALFITEPS